MGGVFVNYRNLDNPLGAAGIYDALVRRFGADNVFRDCVTMEAGWDYPTAIRTALENADVLVAVIGPKWLTLTDTATGKRLIDREEDWVRRELATAFHRNIRVVPVLLQDTPEHASQPKANELPDDIKPLATIQAFAFSQLRFGADLGRLATMLAKLLPPTFRSNGTKPILGPTRRLLPAEFVELADALEAVPCVSNDDTRGLLVSQLRPAISGNVRYFAQRRAHVMGILKTCLDYDDGLADLIAAMRNLEQAGSIPFQDLINTLSRLFPETADRS